MSVSSVSPVHSRVRRRARLARLLLRRRVERLTWPFWRFGTWMFLAAGALVGFEVLEVVLGGFILAPELVPLVLLALATAWAVRCGVRALRRRKVVGKR